MSDETVIPNIRAVLTREAIVPTVTMWNRLEGQPRRADFSQALRAEIRDPLWMLAKQWQVGEFEGDDAASPIAAKMHVDIAPFARFQAADHPPIDFPLHTPIEALVERLPVILQQQGQPLSMDIRLAVGRQWLRLIAADGLAHLKPAFIEAYPVDEPDPAAVPDALITAHAPVWQSIAAVAGRAMDGGKLLFHLATPASHAHDGLGLTAAEETQVDALATRLLAWYDRMFLEPGGTGEESGWIDSRLEYQFGLTAGDDQQFEAFRAEEYFQGHLDWYNLDADPGSNGLGPRDDASTAAARSSRTSSFLPVNVEFDGMPNPRWWSFEEGKTNLGAIKPDTTDVGKLIFMEFGLIYANDWFLLPLELPVGSLSKVRGIAVTNVFGERILVESIDDRHLPPEKRWAMFAPSHGIEDRRPYDSGLLLLPTVPKIENGKPFDDVRLVRDEVSNMVWGIEASIPMADGRAKPGNEAGKEYRARRIAILDDGIDAGTTIANLPEPAADIRYELMRGVPENWIPFIPVHLDDGQREIQLQRASMPRIIEGEPPPPEKVKPRTTLLRAGLDSTAPVAMFIHEEEVPRAGVRVTKGFQRSRWHRGEVFVWVGAQKETGRGEGHSGLAFDRMAPAKAPSRPALRRFVERNG